MELNMLNTTAPLMQTQLEYTHQPTQLILPPETAPLWYAVRVRSKFERNVSIILEHKGVEQFLPTYRSRRTWTDRTKTLDLPLFPGYVFCRIPLEQRNRVVTTDGVVGLVGAGRLPIPVSDLEIDAIRTMVLHGERAYVQAGAGIVADSDPESEYQECSNKASALLRACEKAVASD